MAGGKSGEPAIVAGKAAESEIVRRMKSRDPEEMMPPPELKKALRETEQRTFEKWIDEGAAYEKHWAFVAPVLSPVPSIESQESDDGRASNEIDAFVSETLARKGLSPAPEAMPGNLLRRVTLDLTGLPPTPAEAEAFLADPSAAGYERLVDRLLASPSYGEKWARKWLDLARYADTNGYEKDRGRTIWPYRDWVIRSLNADMAFDQFTIEQIAGDLLPNATVEQRTATGFHRNTMLNEEGGIDPLEFRYYAMVDRVATTSATWLGLTLQCAQCHTHKYDPVTHREYFGIMACLNNADEPELPLPDSATLAQEKERAAQLEKWVESLPARWQAAQAQPITEASGASATGRTGKDFAQAVDAWLEQQRVHLAEWRAAAPVRVGSNLPLLTVQEDASVFVSGDTSKADTYEVEFAHLPEGVTAVRLEVLPDPRLPAQGPGMAYYEGPRGDFFVGEFQLRSGGASVKLASATESYAKNSFGPAAVAALAVDGNPETGWSCAEGQGRAHEAVFVLAEPLRAVDGKVAVTMLFGRHYAASLGRFRISFTTTSGDVRASALPADLQEQARTGHHGEGRVRLEREFCLQAPELAAVRQEIEALRQPATGLTTLVMQERPADHPRATLRYHRGEYTQPREAVPAGVLGVLNVLPPGAPADRLSFARWLVSRDQPLTARVVVNRAWAAFFGRGLVKTQEDFGYQGDLPSHPALLDWLAVRWMDDGWSMKQLHRRIVMSRTYRQTSADEAKAAAVDPENKWLWRGPRMRLDAEEVRDAALAVAGLLSPKMFGPGVFPPQPASVTTEGTYGSLDWTTSVGEDRSRRSLYTYAKRTAPFAFTSTFDAPAGDACTVRRDRSNTPLQALTQLNDVTILEASVAFGKTLEASVGSVEEKLGQTFFRCFSRLPETEEKATLLAFYEKQLAHFEAAPGEVSELVGGAGAPSAAAWVLVCRALLNLDEFLTKQ